MVKALNFPAVVAFAVACTLTSSPNAAAAIGQDRPVLQRSGGDDSNGGGRQQKNDGACTLYSTPNSFGLQCVHSTGDSDTVDEILRNMGGDLPDPLCWDDAISADDLSTIYGYSPAAPGTVYVLRRCVRNIDGGATPSRQPGMTLGSSVIVIPTDAGQCSPPFAEAQADCRMPDRTPAQHVITDGLDRGAHAIPNAILAIQPIQKVRTNRAMVYYDAAMPEGSSDPKTTAKITVGGRTMWAEMTGHLIHPFAFTIGRLDRNAKKCDVTKRNATDDHACVWTYKKSSHNQPDERYPFCMETVWTVYYQTPGGNPTAFGEYHKYNTVRLPVLDVQTLVVS